MVKEYSTPNRQHDSVDAIVARTLDSSNAKDSHDCSLSTSQRTTAKKKIISLMLERSKMSPMPESENSSFHKYMPMEEIGSKINKQSHYSQNNTSSQPRAHNYSLHAEHPNTLTHSQHPQEIFTKEISLLDAKVPHEGDPTRDRYRMSVDDINVAEFSIEVNKSYLTEEYEANLQAAASALTIKTFLTVRSILKPHPLIQEATHALLCLFSGLSDLVPTQIVHRQRVDWKEIKNYLQSPTVLVNYVNCFKDLCYQIDISSVSRAYRLISNTRPDGSYHSDVCKAIREFVKAAIAYFLHIYPQYNLQNLHLFEPNLRDDSIDLKKSQEGLKTKINSSNTKISSKYSQKVANLVEKVPKTPIVRSKTPTHSRTATATNTKHQIFVFQSCTPKASNSKFPQGFGSKTPQGYGSKTPTNHVTRNIFSQGKSSKSPVAAASKDYKSITPIKEAKAKVTPSVKKNKSTHLNKSLDDIRAKNSAGKKDEKKLHLNLQRKIDKALDEKSHRSASVTPKTSSVKLELPPEDIGFVEDLAVRLQLEEEVHSHKHASKQFKQKIAKLLNDENKRVKQEIKVEQIRDEEFDREFANLERRRLEEFTSTKENREQQYDLSNYTDKQITRLVAKQLEKEKEEDYLYHELSQNLEHHLGKVIDDKKKNKENHDVLKERLINSIKDRQFRQHRESKEKEEETKGFKNKRQNELIWKNAEALKERVECEQEYRLLDKLINKN